MARLNNTSIKLLGLALILAFVVTSGLGCKGPDASSLKPVVLDYWGVFDSPDAFAEIIKDYQAMHPNITVNYRKFRYEEYESELLNALAEDRGPDLYAIPQGWIRAYQNKLAPLPQSIRLGYLVQKNELFGLSQQQVVEYKSSAIPSLREIKSSYADTVYNDAVIDGQLYGLPLSLPTLVMYYNKDILNQSGVTQVPADWKSFQDAVVKATRYGSDNKIIQAGTALGTGYNVERCFDIISILMMQSGAAMSDSRGYPTFFAPVSVGGKSTNPGLSALQFYSDFASPSKSVYSWNGSMPSSLESFMAGKVAFFFGYNYSLPQIRAQSRVNFGIAPLPQISGNAIKNYANYWVTGVSKKSTTTAEAWDFILFANKPEEIKKYLAATKQPAAQRALIAAQSDDEDLHAASTQTLTAATWYKGKDNAAAEQAFKEMAERFLLASDSQSLSNLMSAATAKISQTINPATK